MAYLGKTYKFERHEKFDEFLVAIGVPKEGTGAICNFQATEKYEKNGDSYTLTIKGHEGTKTINFKSGEEFVENLGRHSAKTTVVVDGDTIEHTQKFDDGRSINFKKEFSGDKLVVTATNSKWDGVSRRYYSA